MGFRFDLDKIKALPNFSKEDSKELRESYERDAKLENRLLFVPSIPVKKESISELKFETNSQITVSSANNTDSLDSNETKTIFAWNAALQTAYA